MMAGDLLLTVLRSVGQLSIDDLPTRPGHAGWPTATPLAQCHGRDRLQLGIAPITQIELESGTAMAELWEDLFLPIRAVWLRQASPLSPAAIDVRLEGYGLVFSALKPAEHGDAMVLRCYNATGQAHRWTVALQPAGQQCQASSRRRARASTTSDSEMADGSCRFTPPRTRSSR